MIGASHGRTGSRLRSIATPTLLYTGATQRPDSGSWHAHRILTNDRPGLFAVATYDPRGQTMAPPSEGSVVVSETTNS